MTTTSELWVLEWSQQGNVFHVQELDRTLSFNRKLYANDTPASTLQERESTMRELVG